jgi:uncharacterized protein YybS (DUF2232 family)
MTQHEVPSTRVERRARRALTPIEIAEGALLADIAVLLQHVALYLPIFDLLIRFLIPIVLAVLVLRRGLYVGLLGACVAGFVVVALSGPTAVVPLGISCGAGLFLGLAMKRRARHIPLLLLGTTCGTLALCALVLLFTLLSGISPADLARQMERSYEAAMALAAWLAAWAGAVEWWRQVAAPALEPLARAALAYWWALFPAAIWLSLFPVVMLMYFTTNVAVRGLGHDVRPFPGGRAERLLVGLGRGFLRARQRLLRLARRAPSN